MKKVFSFLMTIVLVLLLSCTMSFATGTESNMTNKADASMTLVENNVNHISFGQHGEFEKSLIECNTNEKTIDIGLTVRNTAESLENKDANIVLLIDVSNSMVQNQVELNGETVTRKEAVLRSAQTLTDKLLDVNPDIQIGIVEFSTDPNFYDDEGNIVEDGGGYTRPGTDNDARILTDTLTNNRDTISQALATASNDVMGAQTNIEVGLDAAYSLLEGTASEDVENYIITLTDGVPNVARGTGIDPEYSAETSTPTREKLEDLNNNGVNLISVLIELDETEIATSPEDPKPTYREVAERIFGTAISPTAGSVYYISDEEVENTIANTIYDSLVRVNYVLNNVVIKDYFPQNIIDNFEYAELTEASMGDVTAEVNPDDNSITWTIPTLGPGEEATFSYRLTLKDEFNSEIVGINLPTNENVEITYDENGTPGSAENDASPVVALDVLPKTPIPQTGIYTGLAIIGTVAIVGVIGIGCYSYIKRNKF